MVKKYWQVSVYLLFFDTLFAEMKLCSSQEMRP